MIMKKILVSVLHKSIRWVYFIEEPHVGAPSENPQHFMEKQAKLLFFLMK